LDLPGNLKESSIKWYKNMYNDKEPSGNTDYMPLPRLMHIRRILGCRIRHGPPADPRTQERLPHLALAYPYHQQHPFHQQQQRPGFFYPPGPEQGARPGSVVYGAVAGASQTLALEDLPPAGQQPVAAAPQGSGLVAREPAAQAGAAQAGRGQQEPKAAIADHIARMKGLVGGKCDDDAPSETEQYETPAKKAKKNAKQPSTKKDASKKFPMTTKVKKHIDKHKRVEKKTPMKTMKRPAAASSASGKVAKATNPLAYPGDKKRKPIYYGNSIVYFSPNRFRLMMKKGDRVDVAYSHISFGPRVAWDKLCKDLRKANPKV
jgi:hypothetical protein